MKEKNYGMESMFGEEISLKSVHLDGRLEGALFTGKLRQKYVNETEETIEAIYTFPIAWSACLLNVALELNGNRLEALALPKKQAEDKYEEAIAGGDTPVMIEKTSKGLYTANLGNLKPGEEAFIEVEYSQLLALEDGRFRVLVPTVIGERYGDSVRDGKLAAHQAVETDFLVEYGFTAQISVIGDAALGKIASPSHVIRISEIEGGQLIQVSEPSYMDRDFVITIDDLKTASTMLVAEDGPEFAVVASFFPELVAGETTSLNLKVLVDCSGSMKGDSIEQAQEALFELSERLEPTDQISYSKFGTTVEHIADQLTACTQSFIKNQLAKAIHETDADLGGTNLNKALSETFKISFSTAYREGSDILLITDGLVWNVDEIVQQARRSNHRIFAIGVGSAPAESLLKELAEQTGGACELVTPNEQIQDAVLRVLAKLRATRTTDLSISWPTQVIWQSKLPKRIFSGEAIHVYARSAQKPSSSPTLSWKSQGQSSDVTPREVCETKSSVLPRMVAASELLLIHDEKAATDVALKYQLISAHTNLILVHARSEETKADGLPKVEQIKQMHSAGWAGVGRVTQQSRKVLRVGTDGAGFPLGAASMNMPAVWRASKVSAEVNQSRMKFGIDHYEIPAFLRKDEKVVTEQNVDNYTPVMLLNDINNLASEKTNFESIVELLDLQWRLGKVGDLMFKPMLEHGSKFHEAVAFFVLWFLQNQAVTDVLSRHAKRLLKSATPKYSDEHTSAITKSLSESFARIANETWGIPKSRTEKLKERVKNLFK